jgi:predicted MPP superfamily phosphohydrolase
MPLRFFVFFGTVLSVLAGAHVLVGWRLAAVLGLVGGARTLLWLGLGFLGSLTIVSMAVSRRAEADAFLFDVLVWVGLLWMGLLLLLFTASTGSALLALAGRLVGLPEVVVRQGGLALFVTAFLAGIAGVFTALSAPRIHEVEARIPGLPAAFDGYRIAHITDTHVGPTLRRAWVERLVARVDSARADLVVHTGDFVDGSVDRLRPHVEPFTKLRGKDATLFVTGNHETYSDAIAWSAHAGELGFQVLVNAHTAIVRGSDTLVVGGVTDHREGQAFPGRSPDAPKAFAGAPAGIRILLAHQPVQAHAAQGLGVALQLSGHTHGGQIWPFHHLVAVAQPVVSGFGRVGDVLVFVSNGAGYWGPPMRLFAPPEVPILVLRRG